VPHFSRSGELNTLAFGVQGKIRSKSRPWNKRSVEVISILYTISQIYKWNYLYLKVCIWHFQISSSSKIYIFLHRSSMIILNSRYISNDDFYSFNGSSWFSHCMLLMYVCNVYLSSAVNHDRQDIYILIWVEFFHQGNIVLLQQENSHHHQKNLLDNKKSCFDKLYPHNRSLWVLEVNFHDIFYWKKN